jgi:two-component system cell cycle sensor histidine kinase/response regulator CckA
MFFAALVLPVFSANAWSQEPGGSPKRVLILYSFDNEEGIYAGFDHALRSQVRLRVRDRVEFYTQYLDLVRFPSPAHAQDMVKLLKLTYSKHQPDLIVPVSYAAVQFLAEDGKDLFPGTPVVALFNARRLDALKQISATAGLRITGIASTDEPARTLDLALRLEPDTKHVAVVVGSSTLEQYWLEQLKQDFAPYTSKVEITYLTGQPIDELLKQIGALPPGTIILSTFFFQDGAGQFFLSEEVLDLTAREAHVPIYSIYSSYIGHGVVGGHMTNPETLGKKLADLAVAVLNGESASKIPIVVDDSAEDTVDYRQLQRWKISEQRLPPFTVELFREPSVWVRYRTVIVVAISLCVLETALILALILSVARRRRAERELLREKTLADAVIESLPGVFFLQDEAGRNLRWNKNAQAIVRRPPGDVSILGNIAEPFKDAARQARRDAFERGSGQLEVELLMEGGKTAPFYFTGVTVELEGKPHLAAIGFDMTGSKQSKEALHRSEAELRSFVEHAPYGIGTISVSQDRFLHANPAMVKLLGYKSEAEVLALVVSRDLYPAGDFRAQPTRADFFSALEFTWRRKDGKHVNVRASGRRIPNTSDQGDLIEIIAEDVTARRALEDQVRHAQKLEALGQLSGSVAHDFNNLLSVIIGYSELLSANPNSEGPMRPHLETIKRAGERAASLTAQLLAFSRRQELRPSVVNLNSLVRETQKMLQRLMGENVEQKVVLDPSLWKTKADPGQMVQVIMNLAINARDAMPKGGTLTIETANIAFEEVVTFSGVDVAAGKYVKLSVSDTGTGMVAETLARIYEPFFTTKQAGKGTGLGLATVYGIVKQSGGYIFADSAPAMGTVFSIYLPKADPSVETPAPQSRPSQVPQGAETILIAEDEAAFRELLRDGLQAKGYQVLAAANGVDALRVAEEYAGPIRILVTDVIMPQMSGPELATALRKVRPNTDVMYMSGYTDDKLDEVSSSGELTLIHKPFYLDELVRRIQEILARQNA